MPRALAALCVIGSLSLLPTVRAAEPTDTAIDFFERKIRPVFAEHCYECHSSEAQQANKLKGGLLLDTGSGIRTGGDSGELVVVDKPAESLLIKALRHQELEMPPTSKLPDAVIADVEAWVALGAPVPPEKPAAARGNQIDWEQARSLWAYQVPVSHPRPQVANATWPQRELDYLVLAELERRALEPVGPATKQQWIRRATFDLIGLPPTPEECAAFERDESADARSKVIDRLLASPHYGERWARYWLDLARYADDQGNSFLSPTPQAYLYRDWVVRALNRDLPYDEFLRLQIAGDLVPTTLVNDYVDRLAGLGFQGLGPQFRKGAAGEAKAKADELEDRVDTLSRGLLGLTVSCARCHDHKFDPIPTRDYYSLAAAYNGANWSERMLAAPDVVSRYEQWENDVKQQKAGLESWLSEQGKAMARPAAAHTARYVVTASKVRVIKRSQQNVDPAALAKQEGLELHFLNRWIGYLDVAKSKPSLAPLAAAIEMADVGATIQDGAVAVPMDLQARADALQAELLTALAAVELAEKPADAGAEKPPAATAEQAALVRDLCREGNSPYFVPGNEAAGLLGEAARAEHEQRKAAVEQFAKSPPPAGPRMPSVSGGGQGMQIFVRGNPLNPGDPAPPGFLRILRAADSETQGTEAGATSAAPFTRLELAQAIANPHNPLTARVFVNRVWHYHFGRGIVATLGNFGKLGTPPTHPELLDTLAAGFVQSGWSLKWLHREIMLSATYGLGNATTPDHLAKDPENLLLWRMAPRRLDIEAWRDSVLSVTGKLDPQVGGPSLDLDQPAVKEMPNFPAFSRLNGREFDNPSNGRRTLYCIVSRYAPNTALVLFDFPEPNVASDLRGMTVIPQQQLFVLNSQFMIEMSRAFARRLEQAASTDGERLNLAWRLAYGRAPSVAEAALGMQFVQSADGQDAAEKLSRLEQFCHALLASNEFTFIP